MGRKIQKTRRHKKLKFVDPCYTGPTPLSRKRKKLPNEAPKKEDYQEVSRQMADLINVKNDIKSNTFKKRKKKKRVQKDDFIIVKRDTIESSGAGITKPLKAVPNEVKQQRFESEPHFFNRLQHMVDFAIAEAKIEQKYDIDLINVDKEGEAQYVNVPKETSLKKKEKRSKHKEKESNRKKLKLEDQQFELKKERIQFGDIVEAPPLFTSKPRKAPDLGKAGKKNLVLKKLLNPVGQDPPATDAGKTKSVVKQKRKDMTVEKRQMIEKEQSRAVQMYRILKSKRRNMQ